MARALHRYGHPSDRLEEALEATSERLGLEGHFFSTPTSIFASFGPVEVQNTHLIRVEPGSADLGRLARVDRVVLSVVRGERAPDEGSRALDEIEAAPPAYGRVATLVAFMVASASAARFFGGGVAELASASLAGVATGLLAFAVAGRPNLSRLYEPGSAFVATVLITTLSIGVQPISTSIAVLGGLIVLIPGLTLTVAMTELASRHLVAGTARLSQAGLVFLTIIFGVAAGDRVTTLLLGPPPVVGAPVLLPGWTEWVALAAAPIAFAVLFQVERRDVPWVMVAGWMGYGVSSLGNTWFDPEFAAFLGALAVGLASNLYALALDRSPQIVVVPGVLLLVPGSLGFRSVSSLLDRQVVTGVETAFQMVLIATALVAGLLFANVGVPRRRAP